MTLNGKIIVNSFLRPKESLLQAERLKEEFSRLNVNVDILSDAFIRTCIDDGKINSQIKADFVVYLDKDMYALEMLDSLGIRLFNPFNAIMLCNDKARTYISLSGKGISMPKTFFAPLCYLDQDRLNLNHLKFIASKLGFPIIIKECFGSMGRGVYKADSFDELLEISNKLKLLPHLYQKFISHSKGKDMRVICIGKKTLCAMIRENANDFRSNIALGGKGTKIDINDEQFKDFKDLAEKTASILGLDYCGIDLLFDDNNKPILCEVNSNAFFNEIESVSNVNVAKAYAEYVLNEILSKK